MPNELETLQIAESAFLQVGRPVRIRKDRHLIFTSPGVHDTTGIPICGDKESNIVATQKLHNVTCVACLKSVKVLANVTSYDQALTHVTSIIKPEIQPISEIMEQRHGNQLTKLAQKHYAAYEFLKAKGVTVASDLPKAMIGRLKSTYYFNMTELDLIYGLEDLKDESGILIEGRVLGEPNTDTLATIQEKINNITKAKINLD